MTDPDPIEIPKARVLAALALLALVKLALAARLDMLGDEAFYWECSRVPALGYSDLPPLTAMMVRAGEALFGHGLVPARFFFFLCGTAVPLAIRWVAAPIVGGPRAWTAAGYALALPFLSLMGILAVPDSPMLLASVVLCGALERGLRRGRTGDFALAGLAAAAGVLTHYRFVFALLGIVLVSFTHARLRDRLPTAGPWIAVGLLFLGGLPTLLFNFGTGGGPLSYQFRERHPWTFSPVGLLHPLKQAWVNTPFLYLMILGALVVGLRAAWRGDPGRRVLALFALAHLGPVALLAPFTDRQMMTSHWSLPGYAVLMVLVPEAVAAVAAWRCLAPGRVARATLGLGALGVAGAAAWVAVLAGLARFPHLGEPLRISTRMVGWGEIAARVAPHLRAGKDRALLFDGGPGSALIAFQLADGTPILNFNRGRYSGDGVAGPAGIQSLQYRLWERDGPGLARRAGGEAVILVVVDDGHDYARHAYEPLRRMGLHFEALERLDRFALLDGLKEVGLYLGRGIRAAPGEGLGAGADALPPVAWIDSPDHGPVAEPVTVAGWAFWDGGPLARVEALVDGQPAGALAHGLPRPDVKATAYPDSSSPDHPRVGFAGTIRLEGLPPGRHRLQVRAATPTGYAELSRAVEVVTR